MQKITFTKNAKIQAGVLGTACVLVLLFGSSQKIGLGQAYEGIRVNGDIIGYINQGVDVQKIWRQARRELAVESGERLSMDVGWETESFRTPFVTLLREDELKELLKETLKNAVIRKKERVYTVAIDGYRANFPTLGEVQMFLDKVKAPVDEDNVYQTNIYRQEGHISGILNAVLEEAAPKTEAALQEDVQGITAGIGEVLIPELSDTSAKSAGNGYEIGILDMEFVEDVEVYENYVDAAEISDIEEEVLEVTKEKESNKIYVVENGDCLSVIAMDHDTTVASIVQLNGLSNVDAIREGQELIIAVPEPDLKTRIYMGEVYEEEYTLEPIVVENNAWYTNEEVVRREASSGIRERNDIVVYENGMEISRTMAHQNVIVEATSAIIERGTIIPPTYIKPLSGGRFTSGFGRRWGRMHKGVDWACPVGTTVYASCGGTVIQASYNGGYGKNVVIRHPDGRMTRYAHNSKLLVKVGQTVEQGEPIALSGNTGRSTGPHVHFELYINGSAVNPLQYIGN